MSLAIQFRPVEKLHCNEYQMSLKYSRAPNNLQITHLCSLLIMNSQHLTFLPVTYLHSSSRSNSPDSNPL